VLYQQTTNRECAAVHCFALCELVQLSGELLTFLLSTNGIVLGLKYQIFASNLLSVSPLHIIKTDCPPFQIAARMPSKAIIMMHQYTTVRSAVFRTAQTMAGSCLVETTSDGLMPTTEQTYNDKYELNGDGSSVSTCYLDASEPQIERLGGWLEPTGPAATYLACADMIRCASMPQGVKYDKLKGGIRWACAKRRS
jgi:hypothetical protein